MTARVLRHRTLIETEMLRVVARQYAQGARFAPHRDIHSRITFTLAGAVAEEVRDGSVVIGPGDVLLKSRTATHENRYAPEGARQVSVEFLDEDADGALRRVLEDVWSLRRGADALRHAITVLEASQAGDVSAVSAAAFDVTVAEHELPTRRVAPPRWLAALKDEIELRGLSGVDVASRARNAGVHPAHASRQFRACYGASITDHAQLHAVRRAVAELVAGSSLSAAAAAVGFYDQSHMSRVFRRVTGRTPGAHRKALAAASC